MDIEKRLNLILFQSSLNQRFERQFKTWKVLDVPQFMKIFCGSYKSASIAAYKRLLWWCFRLCFGSLSAGSCGRRNRKAAIEKWTKILFNCGFFFCGGVIKNYKRMALFFLLLRRPGRNRGEAPHFERFYTLPIFCNIL